MGYKFLSQVIQSSFLNLISHLSLLSCLFSKFLNAGLYVHKGFGYVRFMCVYLSCILNSKTWI